MSVSLNDITLAGKTLRNRILFDISDKAIDYYSFVKNIDNKNMDFKNTISNFLKRIILSPKNN